MAAVLASGKTVIHNAAREPEIVDLANLLNKMGARVQGAGGKTITITGKTSLRGAVHKVIPDRIEAATYLIAAAATRGKVELRGTRAGHLKSVIAALSRAGARVRVRDSGRSGERISCEAEEPLKPVSIATEVFPGFPTDVQAQWMALMCTVKGKTVIKETIFENRFLHAAELRRMGAQIEISGRRAVVTGVPELSGADVMVSDLRAGAAMIVAGLMARGRTVVNRIYHLDRGYEDLEVKLSTIGADSRRVRP
jgi:UDP-N-acetylglucosamine 1-carboxyvinyltransferase